MKTLDSESIRKLPFLELMGKIYSGQGEKGLRRVIELEKTFAKHFTSQPFLLFSAPGRVEICGNHTDHNHGKVIAAAVDMDTLGMVAPAGNNRITLISRGYDQVFRVDLAHDSPRREEEGTTLALIRGIAGGFIARGYQVGGFNACVDSRIPAGSGLSSSASFSVLVAEILNTLNNQNRISPREIAQIAQYAENHYFGKPCGLMDQLACAYGGMVTIDFKDINNPVIDSLSSSILKQGYCLLVVNTGGSHADLTPDYAAIKEDMKSIAGFFSRATCRGLTFKDIYENMDILRQNYGDRAVLRAIHYLQENDRVSELIKEAEQSSSPERFLKIINQSGESSCFALQNCYSILGIENQGLMLALVISREYINKIRAGACRVHGGGFAGTILVLLPRESRSEYIAMMNKVFGADCVTEPMIRDFGVSCLNSFL